MTIGKNVAIPDDLLAEVAEVARAEGKTVDELMEETARRMVYIHGLRAFVSDNKALAEQQGLAEGDVSRLIAEFRQEQRGR
jgi:hypothetical protein